MKPKKTTMNVKRMRTIGPEIFKTINGPNPQSMKEICAKKSKPKSSNK